MIQNKVFGNEQDSFLLRFFDDSWLLALALCPLLCAFAHLRWLRGIFNRRDGETQSFLFCVPFSVLFSALVVKKEKKFYPRITRITRMKKEFVPSAFRLVYIKRYSIGYQA
jgi:hypothetical protein